MAITASMVKELREMTGAGMMDCKKALNETNGDMDAAVEFLRKNGQAKAEKKASRRCCSCSYLRRRQDRLRNRSKLRDRLRCKERDLYFFRRGC